RSVAVRVMDYGGLVSGTQSDTIYLDLSDPVAFVSINGGQTYTTSTSATLTLSASDSGSGLNQVRYSNDGTAWSAWEAYSASKAWTLSSGDGTKTVYYQVSDKAGRTTTVTDTIQMDALGPTTTMTLSGEHYRNQYLAPVGLVITASDPGSGVASIWYRIGTSGSFVRYTSPLGFYGLGSYTIYAYAIDNNGHVGSTVSTSFKIVSALPV
ncbi:MAG: hypothetical protein NTY23_11845, partial [Chloroflexi bacterium]|nr:hypothetical protein [Chloroflexota bacterium]